jgi:hypothetical protein
MTYQSLGYENDDITELDTAKNIYDRSQDMLAYV